MTCCGRAWSGNVGHLTIGGGGACLLGIWAAWHRVDRDVPLASTKGRAAHATTQSRHGGVGWKTGKSLSFKNPWRKSHPTTV